VDLINVKDVVKRSRQLDEMGADYLCVHTASDVQATGRNPIEELYAIKSIVKKSKLACAGGINMKTINEIAAAKPEIIIIGTGITKAENPYQTAKAFHDIIARQ
jgi:3-hexulose-6-phosphate synthase